MGEETLTNLENSENYEFEQKTIEKFIELMEKESKETVESTTFNIIEAVNNVIETEGHFSEETVINFKVGTEETAEGLVSWDKKRIILYLNAAIGFFSGIKVSSNAATSSSIALKYIAATDWIHELIDGLKF